MRMDSGGYGTACKRCVFCSGLFLRCFKSLRAAALQKIICDRRRFFRSLKVKGGWGKKGEYEVLRAVKQGRKNPLIIYKRLSTNAGNSLVHLLVLDRDCGVIRAFIQSGKGGKNEAQTANKKITD